MDSSDGGGDGGGGEEREADLSPQGLSVPLRSRAAIPEQGSPTHTSAMAPAKEPLTLPRQRAEGVQGDGQTLGGFPSKQQQCGVEENHREGYSSGQRRENGEVHLGVEEASLTGSGGQEEEEAISNQSQNKSKCSLLPQQSQHCSSSSTAQASGTLHSKTAPTPSSSPKPTLSLCASPKHLTCPSSPPAPHPDTEVNDIKGDQGWISGFPQSFNSQQSTAASPALAGTGPASSLTAEDGGLPGVLHSSVTNGNGAKAPEPNDSVPETEVDDEREKDELKEAVPKNLNQDLSPNSLTSHMTIMHSRNSCKTLKCPKCNWHYKSQHTLQVHMKEKHPETGGQCVCAATSGKCICGGTARGVCTYCSSGKPHPRLARGETYACGYKPYRCEVCDYATSSKGNLSIHMQSDKHLNNVQNGGSSNGHLHVNSTSGGHTADEQAYKIPLAIHTPATQPAKITSAVHSHSHGKRWRCDVCDYETSIARNLRIHTTSEKHTHNMLRLQRGYYLSQCRGLAPPLKHLQSTGAELSLTMRLSSQQVPEQPMALGSTLTPSPSPSPSPPPASSMSPSGALSLCVFQCLICSSFSSDSLECVEQHLNTPRSLPQSEWCSLVAGGCHCRLCGYTTPLRANFSLHCQTDRHRTRYQLAAHIQEGGDRGQEGAALIAKGNPVQLRCNLCDYVSSSLEKLRGHSLSTQHEAGVRVYRFLQQYDGEVDGGSWLFHCLLCNHSCSSKFQVLKHSQTPTHQQREGLIQLQPMGGEELAAIFTIRKNTEAVTGELSDDMETSSEFQIGLQDPTKDSSNLGSKQFTPDKENGRMEREKGELKRSHPECIETEDTISSKRPKIHQQNENQQTVQCPLCQLKVPYSNLRQHLTHVHSVAQDCVDKLISTVSPPIEQPQPHSKVEASPASFTEEQKMKNEKNNAKTVDPISAADAQKNGISTETTESEVAAPKDVTALLTPPLEDNTAHPSNGKVAPQSPTQISPSSPPTSPSSEPPPLTDRHGYRFRCSRCSLAFPTQEKLQLHWQYHAMRAATECPLCSRQCRSQEALQRHMQNTHSGQQLDNSQGQSTHLLPHTAHYMEQNKSAVQQDFSLSPQIGQEAGEGEEEEMEEEALESEKNEQLNEMGSEADEEGLAETEKHEEPLTEPTFTETASNSLIRKSSNPTLDRYLDPSRPYKCTICSESFTQKTILLVHFNSVSHLHRARRALQDTGAGTTTTEAPRGPDPRPYRCKLCGVGYSQSSTLDIHLRSVLHQTRARAAQNTSASAPTSTTVTQAREEPSKTSALTKKPDAASSSTSSLLGNCLTTEAQSALVNSDCQQAKKRVAELLASRNQLMLLQQQQLVQAQAQAHLQQQTALLQSQVMHHLPMGADNLLKHHFPVAADNLLSLQQQLLLPFYLAGDMKLNSELVGKIPDLNQFDFTTPLIKETSKTEEKNNSCLQATEKQNPNKNSDAAESQQSEKCDANIGESCGEPTSDKTKKEPRISEVDKREVPLSTVKNEIQKQEVNASPINLIGQQCPPPRVPYAAVNGEPLRALLQSYGYELALQYIQNRHRHQQQIQFIQDKQNCSEQLEMLIKEEHFNVTEQALEVEANSKEDIKVESEGSPLEMNENKSENKKEKTCCGNGKKCKDCGKFFSDALILKSHQEYIHRMLFPTSALEKFSKEYRLQYDQMYPITQPKSADSPPATTSSTTKATNEECENVPAQILPCAQTQSPTVSELAKQISTSPSDAKPTSAASPPLSPKTPALSQQDEAPSPSTSGASQSSTQATSMSLSLPKIPMLPLPLPQLPIPPLPLSKLPMPPIPFPMELPLLSPVVMQSVALQPQPWLDTSVNQDLAKLYQSQLNPALLGQQPQPSPALLAQQSPLSPALLTQPPQLNPPLIGQPSQSSPVPAGQQPQMSPSILEQQGKRTRTRISEEQLAILRKHFDINSLPSDEEINKMSATSGLPHKVIKHWFRNTLFKERQRDKDSPYNFNNPPTIALEESREEETQSQSLTISPSSMSPALTTAPSQPQPVELQRELHRGRRSSRTRFTEQQLETLQGVFEATPYPREEEYERLSALLSLPNRVIVVWFQNARQRARKSQDRGNEDALGGESKSHFDSIHSQSNSFNMTNDEEDSQCGDGQGDNQNENSMDLTYEYYTNPDSPVPESSNANSAEIAKGEPNKRIQEDKVSLTHDSKTTKNVNEGVKNIEDAHTIFTTAENSEGTQDRIQASSQNQAYVPDTSKESTNLPDVEKSAVSKASEEVKDTRNPEPSSSLSTETKQHSTSQSLPQTQFQCTFCPVSLPSFQLWQEHQTRHLLAAQSQVQLLHSGFTDRTMPYMMLHPNHTLMANQMLTGAMSQLHPNSAHPMISHLNSLQMKSNMSDHSGNSLTNLTSMKQNSKFMAETNFESQRSGKEVEEEHRRDKRQRTTITPEQLEVLYQRYSMDSNPTRGVLESIARDVGLTRRVVQVWFQNTRARERKGQFRSMGPGSTFSLGLNHLRCPFCRALFKVKSALDAHMRSRHWAEAERAGFNLSISNGSTGQIATSSVMERPGPSISSSPLTNPAYPVSKELHARPLAPSLSITTDLNNPDEDDYYEDEEDEFPCEDSSRMAELASSSPEGSGAPSSDWGETPNLQQNYQHPQQQQRQRTQMSHFQILQLRDFYRTHRTPSRHECEALGQELGLPHRVVQVWFQNARAKDKRARSMSSDSVEREAELSAGAGERDRA